MRLPVKLDRLNKEVGGDVRKADKDNKNEDGSIFKCVAAQVFLKNKNSSKGIRTECKNASKNVWNYITHASRCVPTGVIHFFRP